MATPVAAVNRPSTTVESEQKESASTQVSVNSRSPPSYLGRHSCGDTVSYAAARIEAAIPLISTVNRVCILLGVLLLSWASDTDSLIRMQYESDVSEAFAGPPRWDTMNIILFLSPIIQPAVAKLSDVFGRLELLLVSSVFSILGTVIMAAASETNTFVVGTAFHELGYFASQLMLQVIIADVTSLRSRLFFTYIPRIPVLVNYYIIVRLYELMRAKLTWNAGIWLWCAVYPICATPLVCCMWQLRYKTKKAGLHQSYIKVPQKRSILESAQGLFWELDIIGILLSLVGFGLFYYPFCVESSRYGFTYWHNDYFVPMIIGALILTVWVVYERRSLHPMVPFYILRDRAVWGGLGVAFFGFFAWECQGSYLRDVLCVAFNLKDEEATMITNILDSNLTVTGLIVGAIVFRTRRLKWFILTGTLISLISYCLMIYFQGELGTQNGVVASQILMGLGFGFFYNQALVSLQACVKHEHVAVVTALYFTIFEIGSICGMAVATTLHYSLVEKKLYKELGEAGNKWVEFPSQYVAQFPIGDPERDTVAIIFKRFQRVVCIAGGVITILVGIFAFCVRNPRLPDTPSLPYDVIRRHRNDDDHDQDEA